MFICCFLVTETSLTITRVRLDQAGVYQCIAQSKLGSVTAVATLQVKDQSEADAIWIERPELPDIPGMPSGSINPAGMLLEYRVVVKTGSRKLNRFATPQSIIVCSSSYYRNQILWSWSKEETAQDYYSFAN